MWGKVYHYYSMDSQIAKVEYDNFTPEYISLQKEVHEIVCSLVEQNKNAIHVATVIQRDSNLIKTWESILKNLHDPDKYKRYKSIREIKDIAGVRIVCHCEEDAENAAQLLEGEVRQKYSNVVLEYKGGEKNTGKSKPPYRAIHITFSKVIEKDSKKHDLFCEIQIRTVMADAWAIQDRKYIYGQVVEGEAQELTTAVSEIMNGCEKLWSLVKKKSKTQSEDINKTLEEIRQRATESLSISSTLKDDSKLIAWFRGHKAVAQEGFKKLELTTSFEVKVFPPAVGLNASLGELKDKARSSVIRTFGWPIGLFLDKAEYTPKPDQNGIHAEISIKGPDWDSRERVTYDYWALNTNGAFYLCASLFENERKPESIFFDTRIVRTTETILYIANLYKALNVPKNAKIVMTIQYDGLKGKELKAASQNRHLWGGYIIDTNTVSGEVEFTLADVETGLVDIVEKFTKPLFAQFNFFELDKSVLTEIVTNFEKGRVV